jgi:hypothetical protein
MTWPSSTQTGAARVVERDKIKETEIRGACRTYRRDEKHIVTYIPIARQRHVNTFTNKQTRSTIGRLLLSIGSVNTCH